MMIDRLRHPPPWGTITALLSLFLLLALPAPDSLGQDPSSLRPTRFEPGVADAVLAREQIARLRETAQRLRLLASQPRPANLSEEAHAELARHERWLNDAVLQLRVLADQWEQRLNVAGMQDNRPVGATLADLNGFFLRQSRELRDRFTRESDARPFAHDSVRALHETAKMVITGLP
jgi:hypothetical protein